MPRIELRLQPDPALLRVMRMTIVSAARGQQLDERLLDDIRLAATEAAAEAMDAHADSRIDDSILVCLEFSDHEAVVRVEHRGRHERSPAAVNGSVDRLAVVAGIADDLEVRADADGTTCIEMRWSTSVPGRNTRPIS